MGQISRRATGTVRNTDKVRHIRFEIANRMVENLGRIRRSRRKELERERGRILSHNIRDVHDSKSIFVRAATCGQLTKHIFDHSGGSHPNSKSLCQHGHMCAPLTDMSKDLGEKRVAHHAWLLTFCVARRENQTNAEFLARSRGLGPQTFCWLKPFVDRLERFLELALDLPRSDPARSRCLK